MLFHIHQKSLQTSSSYYGDDPELLPDVAPDWRIYFYFTVQLIGALGLTLLLATMAWPSKLRRPRNPLLISLCFSWWISTFPCLCLLYFAGQVTGPPPAFDICLASAALTMSQSVLVATTAPALVCHIWLIVKNAVSVRFSDDKWIYWSTIVCLIMPYALFATFACAALAIGLANPGKVRRVLFYCSVNDHALTVALGAVGTVAIAIAILFEASILHLLHKNRARIRHLSRDSEGNLVDFSLVVRVCIFGGYVFLGLCLNILSILDWTNPIPDLFFATFGLAVFIVFGTQRDIWRVWRTVTRHLGSENSSQAHHGQSTFADGPESEQDTRQSYRLSHIRPDSASRRLSARVSWALNRLSLGASRSSSRNRSGRSPIPLAISRPEGVKKHTVSLPIPAPVGNGRRGHRRSRSDLAFGYTLGNGHPFPLVIPPLSSFSHSHNHHLQQSPKKEVGLSELGFLKSAWSSRKQQVEDDGGKDLGYEVDIESELGSDDLEGWRLGENLELTPGGIAPLHQDASARPRTTSSLPRLVLPSGGGTDPGHATDMPIQELSPTYSSSSTDQYSPLQFSSTSQDAMISFSLETPITSPTRIPLLSSILTSPPQHPSSTLLNTLENSETMTTITTSSPPSSDPFRLSNSLHMSPPHHPHPLVHISSPPPPPPALSWSPSDSFSPTNDVLDTPVLPMIFLPLPSGGGGGRPASAGAGEGGGGRRVSQVSFASAGSGRRGEGDYWHAI